MRRGSSCQPTATVKPPRLAVPNLLALRQMLALRAVLADQPAGGLLAGRRLDRYPLAATLREYVPRVMAYLRELARKGAVDSMRPLSITLTVPPEMEERAAVAAVDTWAGMLSCHGHGSGVLLAEGRGDRKQTRHWHGLALTMLPERYLVKMWLERAPGAAVQAQHIEAIATAFLPLGSPEMGKDIVGVLNYALKQHCGSDIVAREGLAECWREAMATAPPKGMPQPMETDAEPSLATEDAPTPRRKSMVKRVASGQTVGTSRVCSHCERSLEGLNLRRDALHCSKSCRNMASRRKRKRERGKAA